MTVTFHPEAEKEFNDAIDYYEAIRSGLGYDFSIEIYTAVQRSVSLPKTWPILVGEIRRSLVKRFPYAVLYAEEDDGISIIAIMHLHRHPDYWKDRS